MRVLIELRNVWKKLAMEYILRNINLLVTSNKIVCIRGRSGVGKTTLSKILSLIMTPDRGEVWFLGREYSRASERIRSVQRLKFIGYIPQDFQLLPNLTVFENVEIPLILRGVSEHLRKEKVLSVLESVGLKGIEHRFPCEISGGQQQRVAIARALVKDPLLIVADEPFSNLDEHSTYKIIKLFLSFIREENRGLVLLTTDLYAEYPCDYDYLLSNATLKELR